MPDFLAMFDNVLSMMSLGKAAHEATPEEDSSSEAVEEKVETTKTKTHRIVEKRKKDMRERREEQIEIKHQHRHQHKR